MNYKLIACDLDGTLIGSDMKLSSENREAIKELSEQGVMVVPVTGRTICEMREVFDLPEIRYVVYSNGAAIYDKNTKSEIFCGLDEELSHFVLTTLLKYDTYVIIHRNGNVYCDKEKNSRPEDYHICFNVEKLVEDYCIKDENFEEHALNGGGIESIAVFFADGEELKKCRDELSVNADIRVVECWNYNLEIFGARAGKGNALKILTQKLGLMMENVISVGDSDNDTQMILMSGLGLVVENGRKELKAVADKVICTNDEHIMRYINDEYFAK